MIDRGEPGYIPLNSFPKSGNTWVRSFVSHLCFDGDLLAIPDKYRDDPTSAPIYRHPDGQRLRFYKSHDWNLVPVVNGTRLRHVGAVHIRRHPLDVFLSHLNFLHLPKELDSQTRPSADPFLTDFSSIEEIIRKDVVWAFFGVFMIYGTLNPRFLAARSWFDNAEFWNTPGTPPIPVVKLQYEQLLKNGAAEMYDLGTYLGKSSTEVEAAWLAAGEATKRDGMFFWRQEALGYRDLIASEHLAAFRDSFAERLAVQGYEV